VVKRTPFGVRIDDDLQHRIRAHADEIDEKLHREVENALEEYLDRDRYARIEDELRELRELIKDGSTSRVGDGSYTHTNEIEQDWPNGIDQDLEANWINNLQSDLRDRLKSTWSNLIEIGEKSGEGGIINESDFERAVHQSGSVDDRTVQKYKKHFKLNGWLLPDPRDPQSSEYIYNRKKFVVICETHHALNPERVKKLVDQLEIKGRFSESEYRELIPDEDTDRDNLRID